MGIAEAEQRAASGPRCLRWTQLELEWKRRWAFLFFHSLPTSTLRSCFIRRARDGLRATSTPSQACLRGRGRAPNRLHQTIRKITVLNLRWFRVYLLHFYKFGSQGCCIPPSNSNKATDGAIETSRRTTRTDSQEPAPGTSMKPSYDPTKPWSRRRREFGASAQNGA